MLANREDLPAYILFLPYILRYYDIFIVGSFAVYFVILVRD